MVNDYDTKAVFAHCEVPLMHIIADDSIVFCAAQVHGSCMTVRLN